MSGPWASGEAPEGLGACGPATLIEGSSFCISDPGGDIRPGHPQGLFVRDTRVLSRWELTVDGSEPQPLSVQHGEPYTATFLSRVAPRAGKADSTVLVVRRRFIGDGLREDITIRNTAGRAVRCVLALSADADFADLFEVKGRSKPRASVSVHAVDSALEITGGRRDRRQAVVIDGDGDPTVTDGTLTWRMSIPGHDERSVSIEVIPVIDGTPLTLRYPRGQELERAVPAKRLRKWRRRGPQVRTADPGLAAVLDRSVEDLGALRIFDPSHPRRPVVAAGAPWFMALFGRDSLLTAWMLLPWDASLAAGTLQTLAAWQGTEVDAGLGGAARPDPARGPLGPASAFALGGRKAYYGTADATPLFVMLLGELQRWGYRTTAIAALLPHADRGPGWIERYGDADGDGFVEYCRKTSRGLANQGWKDSWDGINFADGTIAEPPIALAEVQGYVYAAYVARAQLAAAAGDETRGAALAQEGQAAQAGLQRAVLAARARLVRHRPGPRQAAHRRADLEHRPLPVDRHRRRRQGRGGGPAPDVPTTCSAAGGSARWPSRWAPTTR